MSVTICKLVDVRALISTHIHIHICIHICDIYCDHHDFHMVNFKSRKCKLTLSLLISLCLEDTVCCLNVSVHALKFSMKMGSTFYSGIRECWNSLQ